MKECDVGPAPRARVGSGAAGFQPAQAGDPLGAEVGTGRGPQPHAGPQIAAQQPAAQPRHALRQQAVATRGQRPPAGPQSHPEGPRRGAGAGARAPGGEPPRPHGAYRRPRPAKWQSPAPASGGPHGWGPGGGSCATSHPEGPRRSSGPGSPAQSSCGRHTGWAPSLPPGYRSAALRAAPDRRRATPSECPPEAGRGKPARCPPTARPVPGSASAPARVGSGPRAER